jgi:hypothetical protein
MDTRDKLIIVGFGLAAAAIGLVWAARQPAQVVEEPAQIIVEAPAPKTPAEMLERQKAVASFAREKVGSHDRALKMLLDSEDYTGPDFCGRPRRSLRNSIEFYANIRFTDFDLALTQDLMSKEQMTGIWNTQADVRAIRQANGRFQQGYVLKSDFRDGRADYLKVFSVPDDATPACPTPLSETD